MRLSLSRITYFLVGIAIFLAFSSLSINIFSKLTGHGRIFGLIDLLSLDVERNIPTTFSVFLLAASSMLLAIIASIKYLEEDKFTRYWICLSIGLAFMAIDENVSLHERLVEPTREILRESLGMEKLGILHFAWVVPVMIIVCFIGLFFIKFIVELPKETRRSFLLVAAIYLIGAIGMELIGGYIAESQSQQVISYSLVTTIEESCEMLGVILFIRALLKYISDNYGGIKLLS